MVKSVLHVWSKHRRTRRPSTGRSAVMALPILKTIPQRWPGQTTGAFGADDVAVPARRSENYVFRWSPTWSDPPGLRELSPTSFRPFITKILKNSVRLAAAMIVALEARTILFARFSKSG